MRLQASLEPTPVSWLVRWSVRNTFRFPLCRCLWSVRRPQDVIYLLKAKTNSFQTLIFKVYFSKNVFRKVYPACTSSNWALRDYRFQLCWIEKIESESYSLRVSFWLSWACAWKQFGIRLEISWEPVEKCWWAVLKEVESGGWWSLTSSSSSSSSSLDPHSHSLHRYLLLQNNTKYKNRET